MKKILFIVCCLFLSLTFVKAESFSEGEYLPKTYIKKEYDGITHYLHSRYILRNSDNAKVFCLDPYVNLDITKDYNLYKGDILKDLNISSDTWQKIQALAYYSKDITTNLDGETISNGYSIAQVLIWRLIKPNDQIYFTKSANGEKTNQFDSEELSLKSLVDNYFNQQFNETYELKYGDIKEITNNKYLGYQINNGDSSIELNNSKINLKADTIGSKTYELSLNKNNNNKIYSALDSQKLLAVDNLPEIKSYLTLKVTGNQINFKFKIDKDVISSCQSNEKTIYGLYDSNNNLIEKYDVDDLGLNFKSKMLKSGYYQFKELSHACDIKENKTRYGILIGHDDIDLNVDLEKNVRKVNLNDYYCQNKDCLPLKDALFEISNGKLKKTLKTDINGQINIDLGIGDYKIKQLSSLPNYDLVNEISLNITLTSPNIIKYDLYNNLKQANLNVKVLDDLDNKITSGRICLYDKLDNLIKCSELNDNGIVLFSQLPLGNYYIKEDNFDDKYENNLAKITVELKDNQEIKIVNKLKKIVIKKEEQKVYQNNIIEPIVNNLDQTMAAKSSKIVDSINHNLTQVVNPETSISLNIWSVLSIISIIITILIILVKKVKN